jgi:hypothetical protein
MPLPEMTEEQEELLKGLPGADSDPAGREAQLRVLNEVPEQHNGVINALFANAETLNEKACIQSLPQAVTEWVSNVAKLPLQCW